MSVASLAPRRPERTSLRGAASRALAFLLFVTTLLGVSSVEAGRQGARGDAHREAQCVLAVAIAPLHAQTPHDEEARLGQGGADEKAVLPPRAPSLPSFLRLADPRGDGAVVLGGALLGPGASPLLTRFSTRPAGSDGAEKRAAARRERAHKSRAERVANLVRGPPRPLAGTV
jgi:hypothetical protein